MTWSRADTSGATRLRDGAPAELLIGGHYAATPKWSFNVGLGHGLTDGAGTPTFG